MSKDTALVPPPTPDCQQQPSISDLAAACCRQLGCIGVPGAGEHKPYHSVTAAGNGPAQVLTLAEVLSWGVAVAGVAVLTLQARH